MSRTSATAWLESHRNDDGSWGYVPGSSGRPEPVLHCAALGLEVPLDWLRRADLGYAQLLLPAALARTPGAEDLCRRTLDVILALRGKTQEPHPDLAHDPSIPGWSWAPGTASWVEPTSYAVLSLRRWGLGEHPRAQDGLRLLRDRQCADGGWNYGNTEVLGATLESDLPPTAWACLALGDDPAVERAIERLELCLRRPSTLNLSLGVLVRVARGLDVGPWIDRLVQRQAPDGSFGGRVDLTALAALALAAAEEGSHVFAVPS